MHTADWLDLITELLPRGARRVLGILLALGLLTGVATPAMMWLVDRITVETAAELAPFLGRMPTPSPMPAHG